MEKNSIASIVLIVSALPALGMGMACMTRRWMPQQFSRLANSLQLQFFLGLGMTAISLLLMAFGILVLLLSGEWIASITPYFVVILNIVALAMALMILRNSKKTP